MIVNEEVPSGLLTLKLPPGMSLDRWVKEETERLRERDPYIRTHTREVGTRWKNMYDAAARRRKTAETQYELCKLKIRDKLGDAESATAHGEPFLRRRIYPVPAEPAKLHCPNCGSVFSKDGYWVDSYEMDAMFPV